MPSDLSKPTPKEFLSTLAGDWASRCETAVKGDGKKPCSSVTIDGGEIGWNTALSADAVAFCVRVFMHLAPRGRRLDLARWGYGFAARFHRGSMRNVALKSLCKVGSVVRVDLRVVPTTQ
jgi:hypothetical protein